MASDEKSGHGRYLTRMSDRGPTGRAYGQGNCGRQIGGYTSWRRRLCLLQQKDLDGNQALSNGTGRPMRRKEFDSLGAHDGRSILRALFCMMQGATDRSLKQQTVVSFYAEVDLVRPSLPFFCVSTAFAQPNAG